jgi:hypothetical protein
VGTLTRPAEAGSPGTHGRLFKALGAATLTLLVVSYPLIWALSLSHAAFSGCWLACGGEHRPVIGMAWALVGGVLLSAPLMVGLRIADVRARLGWLAAGVLVLVAVTAWVYFSMDPANAEFFVASFGMGGAV